MVKPKWSEKYGFYLVTVGSAFSLGNVWRFPNIVQSEGGGAFVLIYILLTLLLGLPILIAELMLGKSYRKNVVSASEIMIYESESAFFKKYNLSRFFGWGSIFSSLFLLSLYSVICGWVLFYFFQYVSHLFSSSSVTDQAIDILLNNGWLQILLTCIHVVITALVVSVGLKIAIEKISAIVMPLFTALLVFLVAKSLSLEKSIEALRFLFYPNFSSLDGDSLLKILGHVCFTLSVGMGAMVVFGGFLQEKDYVPRTALKVSILDVFVSIFIGLLLFPVIFSLNTSEVTGYTYIFSSLPVLFDTMGFGNVFGFFFFLCLYMAALSASVMLLETSVSNLIEREKRSRMSACLKMSSAVFILAMPAALSSTFFKNFKIEGLSVFGFYDRLLVELILPLVTLGLVLGIGFGMSEKRKKEIFISDEEIDSDKLYRNWHFIIRWVVPLVILVAFIFAALD